jgi:hypothetical protein
MSIFTSSHARQLDNSRRFRSPSPLVPLGPQAFNVPFESYNRHGDALLDKISRELNVQLKLDDWMGPRMYTERGMFAAHFISSAC